LVLQTCQTAGDILDTRPYQALTVLFIILLYATERWCLRGCFLLWRSAGWWDFDLTGGLNRKLLNPRSYVCYEKKMPCYENNFEINIILNIISLRGNNSALPSPKCIGCSDASPNSPLPTNYYSITQFSNPSGPMVYNSGALLPPPTLKFWNDSNLRLCAWLWTPHGTSLIHSSEGTSTAQQS
jgi:hypothetical protein